MVEIALSFVVLFLLGCLAITLKGGWDLQKKVNNLEQYAYVVTRFSIDISGLSDEEVGKKLEVFTKKLNREMEAKRRG